MSEILTPDAIDFLRRLHREFEPRRQEILAARRARAARVAAGEPLDFLSATAEVREAEWSVAPAPADLDDRRVEITGPAEPKMVINALNSGAKVFMADFEDALSPTWDNLLSGQRALSDAVRRTLTFENPDGKRYELGDSLATLVVRPRGWHLDERHFEADGQPMSGALFDFGLYLLRNGPELIERGSGPYFYLAKLQGHSEARLWNDVFVWAQDVVGIARGSIRATVLVETIWAAFEMDEILYELREHAAGLNAGRWDYIFSLIKTFADRADMVLPDRVQVTMGVPFMRAYAELLVRTCHRRGAHAIGGMSAFIPNRREPDVTERALAKVREDKQREASQGFDGTWVAHPDLVPVAMEIFDHALGDRPNQKDLLRDDVSVSAAQLLDVAVPGGEISEAGLATNVSVGIRYIAAWLSGTGAAALDNLMEDAATAEISRSQVWQWVRHGRVSRDAVLAEIDKWRGEHAEAAGLFEQVALGDELTEFLTLPAYELLP
ncbi:MAG TPA: malate synthase A [Candidatus Limnocylindrales bacterium]|jgi:malate synthase|nr:malate synthase A [Candidatus Limnocylindrales bacterium]